MITIGLKYIFLFSILTILFIGCHKDTHPPPPPLGFRHTPTQLLEYSIFKPGSYWIYQDTNTKRIDSVYVTGYEHDTVTANYFTGQTQKGDQYLMYFTDVYNGYSYQYYIPIWYDRTNPNTPVTWFNILSGGSTQGFGGTSYPTEIPIPFNLNGVDFVTDSIQYCSNYFKLSINNVVFDSVFYQKHSHLKTRACNQHGLGRRCKEYYAPHYGLIRYELPDSNQVWNLLRYKLDQ